MPHSGADNDGVSSAYAKPRRFDATETAALQAAADQLGKFLGAPAVVSVSPSATA